MRIISGGQTGVDRAALDFALKRGMVCGGWCPKGRLAEDGQISDTYPLKEASASSYRWRTELNVRDSDGTLVICSGSFGNGTELTIQKSKSMNKPLFIIDLEIANKAIFRKFKSWKSQNNIIDLNIAGPRESTNPGIYDKTLQLLEILIK